MKQDIHPDDGKAYYQYILLYCDDILSIGHAAATQLEKLDHYFQMKPGSIADPDVNWSVNHLGHPVNHPALNVADFDGVARCLDLG